MIKLWGGQRDVDRLSPKFYQTYFIFHVAVSLYDNVLQEGQWKSRVKELEWCKASWWLWRWQNRTQRKARVQFKQIRSSYGYDFEVQCEVSWFKCYTDTVRLLASRLLPCLLAQQLLLCSYLMMIVSLTVLIVILLQCLGLSMNDLLSHSGLFKPVVSCL